MYDYNDGVKKDYKKSRYWYEQVAQQDNAKAQWSLGFMYYSGNGVKEDYEQASY